MTWTVLSLWQPWASLIALGLKTIETRTDPAPQAILGTRVAIHASRLSKEQVFRWLESQYPEAAAQILGGKTYAELPTGLVLATARLAESRPTDWRDWPKTLSTVEGLWGWVLEDIRPLARPIPLEGEGGLREVELDIPEEAT